MKFFTRFSFVVALAFTPAALQALTLEQLFQSSPKVADFRPGPYALHTSDEEATIRVDGKLWEVRYVTYSDAKGTARHRTLKELARDYNLTQVEGKEYEVNPLVTTTTWFPTDEMKEEGVYFTISIKSLESNLECIGCKAG